MQEADVRRHHYDFAHRVLPQLVHRAPREFLEAVRREGDLFLKRVWENAGSGLPLAERLPPSGLAAWVERAADSEVVLVALPEPDGATEAHFVAAVVLPAKKGWFGKGKEGARYLTLERTEEADGEVATALGEWEIGSRGEAIHRNHGTGPRPERAAFLAAICRLLV
ncbi:MAG: hypothetical protein HY720_26765 [Planctomycetes bacterium]|nr:hypothetical protein [Planctomycetota bacterium]